MISYLQSVIESGGKITILSLQGTRVSVIGAWGDRRNGIAIDELTIESLTSALDKMLRWRVADLEHLKAHA